MKKWSKKLLKKEKGFTLIELIVVIAIIAILAAVLLPQFNVTDKAHQSAVRQEATMLTDLVILHETGEGTWPTVAYDGGHDTLTYDNDLYGTVVINNVTLFEGTDTDVASHQIVTSQTLDFTVTRDSEAHVVSIDFTDGSITVN